MTFLVPLAGWLAVLTVPISLLYILRVRWRRQPVSTTMFWQRVAEEHRIRSLWRRLRRLLSLLVNLLFLLLLVAAVMHPVFSSRIHTTKSIIVLDNSLSMNAIEADGTSRLDAAKMAIRHWLSSMPRGHQVALLTAGGEPRVVVGFTERFGAIRKKLEAIEPGTGTARLADAVKLAKDISLRKTGTKIHVYTDGCSVDIEPLRKDGDLRFSPIGGRLENTAIVKFQPRRTFGAPVGYELLAEVVHFGEKTVECRFEVDLDGIPVDVVPLTLRPNVPQMVMIQGVTEKGGVLRGTLDVHDALPADDTASAPLADDGGQNILFHGDANFFLDAVLQSQPNTAVHVVDDLPETIPADSVLVVHQTVPEKLPGGNVLLMNPCNSGDLLRVDGNLGAPLVGKQEQEQPLLRFVHLANVVFPGARRLEPVAVESEEYKFVPMIETPAGEPLYVCITTPENRVLALSAELSRGELALRTAFPILIANALMFFRGDGGELQPATLPGDSVESDLSLAPDDFYRLRTEPSGYKVAERPLWFWPALAALLLSVTEWWAFQRRLLD